MRRLPYITLGTVLRWLLIAVVIGAFVAYVVWQSRIFLTGPVLTISEAPPATTTAPGVTLAGRAENIVWITLNDRPIVTTPEGDFKEYVILERGYTVVQLEAADRFGRITTHLFPVTPITSATTSDQPLTD
jgi:hypothetical protein